MTSPRLVSEVEDWSGRRFGAVAERPKQQGVRFPDLGPELGTGAQRRKGRRRMAGSPPPACRRRPRRVLPKSCSGAPWRVVVRTERWLPLCPCPRRVAARPVQRPRPTGSRIPR